MRAKTVGRKRMVERNQCGGEGVVRSGFIVEDRLIRVQYTVCTNNTVYFIHIGLLMAPPLCVTVFTWCLCDRPICSCSRWLHLKRFWPLDVSGKIFFHTYLIVYSALKNIFISIQKRVRQER